MKFDTEDPSLVHQSIDSNLSKVIFPAICTFISILKTLLCKMKCCPKFVYQLCRKSYRHLYIYIQYITVSGLEGGWGLKTKLERWDELWKLSVSRKFPVNFKSLKRPLVELCQTHTISELGHKFQILLAKSRNYLFYQKPCPTGWCKVLNPPISTFLTLF